MLLVYSGGVLLVSSLFSSGADLIHDAFSMFSSTKFGAGDGETDDGSYSLELRSSIFLFDFINGGIDGSSFESTLQSDFDSPKSSISH